MLWETARGLEITNCSHSHRASARCQACGIPVNRSNGNNILDSSKMLFDHVFSSAAGAGFNSHGREAGACALKDEIEARRADRICCELTPHLRRSTINALEPSTASRPWLLNDGPSNLPCRPSSAGFIPIPLSQVCYYPFNGFRIEPLRGNR